MQLHQLVKDGTWVVFCDVFAEDGSSSSSSKQEQPRSCYFTSMAAFQQHMEQTYLVRPRQLHLLEEGACQGGQGGTPAPSASMPVCVRQQHIDRRTLLPQWSQR